MKYLEKNKKKIFFFIIFIIFISYIYEEEYRFEGLTKPYRKISLYSSETGIIEEIRVKEGSKIKKGQILAKLRCDLLKIALKIAIVKSKFKGELNSAISQLDLVKNKYKRIMDLKKKDLVKYDEIQQVKTELKLAEAHLLSIKEKLKVLKLEVEKIKRKIKLHYIKSPINGVIRKIIRDIGETVSPSQPIFEIVQLDFLKIIIYVDFLTSLKFKIGKKVIVFFPQIKEKTYGKVIFIDPIVESGSNTVKIFIKVSNKLKKYKAGIKCIVILKENSKE